METDESGVTPCRAGDSIDTPRASHNGASLMAELYQPDIERMPRDELAALQLSRLRALVERLAGRVPFYRDALAAAGAPGVESLEALARLPFTSKADLRESYPLGLLAVPQDEVVRIHASSGTKGKATIVAYTRDDLRIWAEVCARAVVAAGGRSGDVFHNAYGYGLFTGGLGMHYGAELLGCAVVPASGGVTARQAQLIADLHPRGLAATPSYALTIADALEAAGHDPAATSVEYGIFGAEPWSEEMRSRLEARLGLRAVDIYGLSEVIGPGVSIECADAQSGLHIAEDHFLAEIVDPITLDPVAPGGRGELVITTLTKQAYPVLRYRTGDLTSIDTSPCACGRTHARMARVLGRVDDMLIVRGVNVFPSEIERIVCALPELAPTYQLIVDRLGTLDELTLLAEAAPGQNEGGAARETLSRVLERRVKDLLGVTLRADVLPDGSLPMSEGKAVRVVDRRR
jgi:phenylacetate-CoA ligase